METFIAFGATGAFTLFFQTIHWAVQRRRGETRGWIDWFTSAEAWITGWPIALVVGSYVVIYVVMQASSA